MVYTVLHCLASMNIGGAETFIMNIYRHIDRTKYNFCFLLNKRECDYTNEIEKLGGKIYTISPRSRGIMSYCKALDTFFEEHKGEFNAIHLHTSSLSSLEVLYYAKKHGIKKRIIHSHSTKQEGIIHNIIHWLNKPHVKNLATDYLACSIVALEWLYKYTGIKKCAIVINNGIDLERFRYCDKNRDEVRRNHGIASDEIVIGHVGRFDIVKNHSFLIEIFESYQKINPHSRLVCVGTGATINNIKELVARKGLENKVIFAGLQQDIHKYLSSFDYFVFPSLYEGLPVALVEAQASGLMIICSNKVSPEARLSNYLSHFPLENNSEEWANYISNIPILDREQWIYQLEEKGYNILKTVEFLTHSIYNETF